MRKSLRFYPPLYDVKTSFFFSLMFSLKVSEIAVMHYTHPTGFKGGRKVTVIVLFVSVCGC